jgi:PAS domain S-box-containing protein
VSQPSTIRLSRLAALRPSRKRLEVLEHLPLGVYETDVDGRIVYVNSHWCELSGIPREEAEVLSRGTVDNPEEL